MRKKLSLFFYKPQIAVQLLFWFLLVGILSIGTLTYVVITNVNQTVINEIQNNLTAIATRQAEQIKQYINDKEMLVEELSSFSDISIILEKYSKIAAKNPQKLYSFVQKDSIVLRDMQYYKRTFGIEEVLLLNVKGDVVFSSTDKPELGLNVRAEAWIKKTEISKIFDRSITYLQTQISDFTTYGALDRVTAFISTPVYNQNRRLIGVLIAQINNTEIEKIVNDYTGLGKTGESKIVAWLDSQMIFVTKIRHTSELFVKKEVYKNNPSHPGLLALQGKSNFGITKDYRGIEVIAYWRYIPSMRSGIVVKMNKEEAFEPITSLQNILIWTAIIIVIFVIIVSTIVAGRLSKPIRVLTKVAKKLAEGDLSKRVKIKEKNEIGDLAATFNTMAEGIERQQKELQDYNANLEETVENRTYELKESNEELLQLNEEMQVMLDQLSEQKEEIEHKNTEILSSIHYAKRIQTAMLPTKEQIESLLPESFVFFHPRDIVSGDFYLVTETENKVFFAAVDCTGHGVPGAFMSMIGNELLNEIIHLKKIIDTDKILYELHHDLIRLLRQTDSENKDGMDIVLCAWDKVNNIVEFSGAYNPIIYIQNGLLYEIKGTKQPIGGWNPKLSDRNYQKHTIEITSSTMFYLLSDGYQDQFGGEKGRKYMIKNMKEVFLEINHLAMDEQQRILAMNFFEWLGKERQIDDVLLMGVRIDKN
ncbi:MAG: HAMP domain-containing protein [Cytophagia bacterium]|nr:MAG: HAMP domain-containing protein [Cytophagia bacterium]TAG39368.1 MAG: HAMP domain-containing protein [Cytophagia bacterium]TAH28806.1 MAG: HAMP domain-containing protein [Cytophagales bacterium]